MALSPLADVRPARRPSAAEQARTIMAGTNVASLASLTGEGDPWASMVTFGLVGGVPVLCLSDLALHGRNLTGDQRGSLAVAVPGPGGQRTRPTAAGSRWPGGSRSHAGEEAAAAQAAYNDAVASAEVFTASPTSLSGSADRDRALGRRLRADGLGGPRELPGGRGRPRVTPRRVRGQPPERGPRRRAAADGPATWPATPTPPRPPACAPTATAWTWT